RSSASRSREVVLLARPVVAASSVKVTEPGECTTSVRSLAARSTACVPLGLVTMLPACALPPPVSVAVVADRAPDSSILQNHVLLCDLRGGTKEGKARRGPPRGGGGPPGQARKRVLGYHASPTAAGAGAGRRPSGVPGAEAPPPTLLAGAPPARPSTM